MIDIFSRSRMLLHDNTIETLKNTHVLIFGVGGVGGHCIESLIRTGVGEITIVDHDVVSITNINRQIISLHSTIGQSKVEVMKSRALDINPKLILHTKQLLIDKETIKDFDFSSYDYIIDAIDSSWAKLSIIKKAISNKIPIISCMGTGNKLDPTKLTITDISKTTYCPLARMIRKQLKKDNIYHLKVLASSELAIIPEKTEEEITSKSIIPGSVSFVPNIAGILISREVILDISLNCKK